MPLKGHGQKLSRNQERAIVCLLEETSVVEAAKKAKLSDRTIRNWIKDPTFTKAYKAARRRLVDNAVRRLQGAASEAVDELQKIMRHKDTHQGVRVRAAVAILDFTFKGSEFVDLSERIETLEDEAWASLGDSTLPDWMQDRASRLN